MKDVEKVYQDLKAKGIEFPMTDLDHLAPIHTPARVSTVSLPKVAGKMKGNIGGMGTLFLFFNFHDFCLLSCAS